MEKLKRYYKQGVGLVLMCLICVAAIGYGNGAFDLSFATRTPAATTPADPAPTPTPDWDLPSSNSGGASATTSANQLAAFGSLYDALAANKTITTDAYSSRTSLTVAPLGDATALPFSLRLATVAREVRVLTGNGAAYRSEVVFTTEPHPIYRLYMGYILYENGTDLRLLSGTGELLLTDFTFTPAFVRDAAGRPLFTADGVYFYYDVTTRRMCTATYTDTALPLATEIDYAAPVTSPFVRFCENGKWGYKLQETGEVVIPAQYVQAYEFQKNGDATEDRLAYAYLAVVFAGETKHLQIINTEGTVVVDTYTSCDYTLLEGSSFSTFEAWDGCFLPERTDSVAALGMDSVDSYGMVRVRRRIVRKTNRDVVPVDTDTLLCIRRNGDDFGYHATYFNIPAGYRLCAYTEGVLLLEDTMRGTYGYYSYDGRWIVDPDLAEATPMREGLAAARTADGKMGLLSADGNWVLLPTFDYVSACSDGVVLTYDSTVGWRLLCKVKG